MRALIAILLACFALNASAATLVARKGDDVVRITDEPCDNADVLKRIKEEYHEQFHRVEARIDGQVFSACWAPLDMAVYVKYPDGDSALIPLSDFKTDGA